MGGDGKVQAPEETFEAAFHRHYSRVYAIALRIAASDTEAEELTQETFLRLCTAAVLHRPEEEVGAWLARVVTNLALNAARGNRREQDRMARAGDIEVPDIEQRAAAADPALVVARREERDRVRAVLGQLSARARACLVLRHSGLSYAEIAEALGIAPGSVGTTLVRAEAAFAKMWKEGDDAG